MIISSKVQTENDDKQNNRFAEDESGRLGEFLRNVTPYVIDQLEKNNNSHAFDGMWYLFQV